MPVTGIPALRRGWDPVPEDERSRGIEVSPS